MVAAGYYKKPPATANNNYHVIRTFCSKCGTNLFWKAPTDVARHVYINLECLQSDWLLLPSQPLHQRSSRETTTTSSTETSSDGVAQATVISSQQQQNFESDDTISTTSIVPPPDLSTPPRKIAFNRTTTDEQSATPSTNQDLAYVSADSYYSATTGGDDATSVVSTHSSTAGFRLIDPNRISSPSDRRTFAENSWDSKAKNSPDAMLVQMRRHLGNKTSSFRSSATTTSTTGQLPTRPLVVSPGGSSAMSPAE